MQKEKRTCRTCQTEFLIQEEDFTFYNKLAPGQNGVPSPMRCPPCRLIRRMAAWNERALYKRTCAACGKSIISVYSNNKPYLVYCGTCWWRDAWEATDFAQRYDFSKSFFEQFQKLRQKVPRINLSNRNSVNSEYCHDVAYLRNCYLCFLGGEGEDSSYATHFGNIKMSFDVYKLLESELCYENVNCAKSYRLFFSENSTNCRDSYFLSNCHNCSDCFGCVNLKNKRYYIFNIPYSKEEYHRISVQFEPGSYERLSHAKRKYVEFVLGRPRPFALISQSEQVSGDRISGAKRCHYCFDVDRNVLDCKYFFTGGFTVRDCYDIYNSGQNLELSYESVAILESHRVLFSSMIWGAFNVQYSDACYNVNDCFGCIGLRNKQYCILNRQYTKAAYEEMVPRIIRHMNEVPYVSQQGDVYTYGEFFPEGLSPFAYNETVAQHHFPLTKAEALARGYEWKDQERRNFQFSIIDHRELPDHIKDVPDSIVEKAIQCAHVNNDFENNTDGQLSPLCAALCTQAFRITASELDFYRSMNIALPRQCPNCRYHGRLTRRTPLKLWRRKCMCGGTHSFHHGGSYENTATHYHGTAPCTHEFETSYPREQSDIVYCKECYQMETN